MLFRRHRHRHWIALIALLGLLFQQLAMATYICPMESGGTATTDAISDTAPWRCPDSTEKMRCLQHCHPLHRRRTTHQPHDPAAALLPV
jgi:hypothetical protein